MTGTEKAAGRAATMSAAGRRFSASRPVLARILLAAFVLLATAVAPAGGSPQEELDASRAEHAGGAWFVELASPPAADGTSLVMLGREHGAFRAAAARAGVPIAERASFRTLWNGLSVEIAPRDLPALARLRGVKALYPVETVELPEVRALESPELASALAMTGADAAQSELGLNGAGVRVAVMDTGIDYHHPDLGGCFGPGCKVETGWDFVGDNFNATPFSPGYDPTPAPDPDPDDCRGHGTHVAGIVGAAGDPGHGGAVGVAPGVTLGAYKVFGCAGSTTADIMIAAMERTLADGMQVLNMSIGSAFQWPQHPIAQAGTRLVNSGVTVVASIGNNGGNGLFSSGAPGVGGKVIGVASFDNSHVDLSLFTISPDDTAIGYGAAIGAPTGPTAGSLSMARTGTPSSSADACDALPAGSLTGSAALIRRGTCTFHQKALNAQSAGAAAVVLYNNVPGRFGATVAASPQITIPVVVVSDTEGVLIDGRLAAGPVAMTWTGERAQFVNVTGGRISSFSSYGLSPDLDLKPDIGAPGGLIRATYPLELGGYATLSGTSMSAPHVAGAVALLLEARPSTPSQAVRGILQNHADPRPWWGEAASSLLDNVHRQGAGMLDIPGAVLGTTSLSPAKLALGESEAGSSTRTLTIHNGGAAQRTYALTHVPALSTGPDPFNPSFPSGFAGVAFSPSDVTVPAGGSAPVAVTITANAASPERSQYGGYIVATADDGEVLRVPYAGLRGDYQSMRALTPTPAGFPWLARLVGTTLVNQPSGAAYTLRDGDVPFFVVHLDHQVRRLRLTVSDAASGKSWHRALDLQYLGRGSAPNSFFTIGWDGVTVRGNGQEAVVPSGDYRVHLEVLKALGDESNPAHWETWTSPVITIAQP